jgi:Na+-translocating ferredoxin:NAD+ oxidoreductase RNF subunit RnfB
MKIKNSVMKIGKGILLASVLATSTFAVEKYTKVDRIKDMLTIDDKCIPDGVKTIKKVLHTIEKVDPKDFLDEEQVVAHKFAKKTRVMLEMYLDEMEDELRRNNPDEVIHNYSLALRQCTSCHLRLRK